jgi:hypothetical protein
MPFWISHFVFRNVNIQIALSDLENHHILILIKFSSFKIVVYLTSSREITQERVEYNIFLFDEPPKGSKSLKIPKISPTPRFDKLSNLSKSVHIGENIQILTVSNKKKIVAISVSPFCFFAK